MYEARIKTNEAEAEELKQKVEETTKKLKLQQQALANMLVNLHFEEGGDAIMILAGSSSISDFAERQTRADTAKNQVTLSAQTVKSIKQDLEKQKTEVERVIADQQIQRKAVEDKKTEQQELILKYRDNAAAFALEAASSREEKIKLINQEYNDHLSRMLERGFGTIATAITVTTPSSVTMVSAVLVTTSEAFLTHIIPVSVPATLPIRPSNTGVHAFASPVGVMPTVGLLLPDHSAIELTGLLAPIPSHRLPPAPGVMSCGSNQSTPMAL